MGNKEAEYGIGVMLCALVELIVVALYLQRQDMLNDAIWALPIAGISAMLGLFYLAYFQREFNELRKGSEDKK
jgi:hypothetical protein